MTTAEWKAAAGARLDWAWAAARRVPHRKSAEAALRELLADAQRGTLPGAEATGATFRDAAAEYLRFVEEVRQIDADTAADYRGVIDGYLLGEFGDLAIEEITPDLVDAYRRSCCEARSRRASGSSRTARSFGT